MPKTVTEAAREKFDKFSEMCDGVLVINDEMSIVHADANICAFLGYKEDELIGEHIRALLPRSQHEGHDAKVAEFKRTGILKGKMATTAIAAYDKDGKTHEMRGIPGFIEGFGVVGIVNPDIRVAVVQQAMDSLKDPVPDDAADAAGDN